MTRKIQFQNDPHILSCALLIQYFLALNQLMHSQLKLKDMSMTALCKNVPVKKGNEELGNS